MHVTGGDNAGLGCDNVWLKLMSKEKETLLQKRKAKVTIF